MKNATNQKIDPRKPSSIEKMMQRMNFEYAMVNFNFEGISNRQEINKGGK